MSSPFVSLGSLVRIRTGKLDANASSKDGKYPFFTCAVEPLRINSFSYDCECVLVAGNGDLNAKYYKGKFDAYQRTYIIESLDSAKLDTRYLFHFMDRYVAKLRQMSIGGVIKYIKLGYLTEAQIPLPPLPEQKRIAAILDKADAIRRKREKAIELIDSFLQSVFLEMFGDFSKGIQKCPVVLLGEICHRITDGTHQSPKWASEGVPFLFVSNVVKGQLTYSTDKFISEETFHTLTKRCPIETGDVLYTTVGSYGNAALVGSNTRFCFQRHIAHLKPNPDKINSRFLHVMLGTPSVKQQADSQARGVAQKTLNLSQLKEFKVLMPSMEEQKRFALVAQKADGLVERLKQSSLFLSDLSGSLQQHLFGRVQSNNLNELQHLLCREAAHAL
jgi:type I restriction enzyme S subunit